MSNSMREMTSDDERGAEVSEDDTSHLLKALDHGRHNEEELNHAYMEKSIGKEVRYGDQVQLCHVKSSKYITVTTTQTAETERENLVVMLNQSGSALSWLTVMPRLKIDQEGDVVRNASDVYFKVSERNNEFLHCSEKTIEGSDEKHKEVNCSLEKTSWKLIIFDHASPELETDIRCNDMIFLMDPEAKAYLRLPPPVSNTGETDFFAAGKRRQSVHDASKSGGRHGVKGIRDAFMEPFFDITEVDSNCMWLVEKKAPLKGGKLIYDEEQYRFRHLNSKLYLAVEPKSRWHKSAALISTLQGHSNKHREAEEYKFVSSPDGKAGNTLFTLHSAHHRSSTQENCIHNMSAMFLESYNARYLKRGDYNYERVEGKAVFDVNGIPKKIDALAMIITSVPSSRRADVAYGMDALPILVEFKSAFMQRDFNSVSAMLSEVVEVMSKLTNFCIMRDLDEELSYSVNDLAHLQSSSFQVEQMKETVRNRQQLFREQVRIDEE